MNRRLGLQIVNFQTTVFRASVEISSNTLIVYVLVWRHPQSIACLIVLSPVCHEQAYVNFFRDLIILHVT